MCVKMDVIITHYFTHFFGFTNVKIWNILAMLMGATKKSKFVIRTQ